MRITRRGLGGVALAAGLGASAARAAAGVLNVATIGGDCLNFRVWPVG